MPQDSEPCDTAASRKVLEQWKVVESACSKLVREVEDLARELDNVRLNSNVARLTGGTIAVTAKSVGAIMAPFTVGVSALIGTAVGTVGGLTAAGAAKTERPIENNRRNRIIAKLAVYEKCVHDLNEAAEANAGIHFLTESVVALFGEIKAALEESGENWTGFLKDMWFDVQGMYNVSEDMYQNDGKGKSALVKRLREEVLPKVRSIHDELGAAIVIRQRGQCFHHRRRSEW